MLGRGKMVPREYQKKIAEEAVKSNTLVVLPTGLGKTAIAILAAQARFEKFPDGKVLVLAPTRPLTFQHFDAFKEVMALPKEVVAVLTGTTDPRERSEIWSGTRLIFATPQTVFNDVKKKRVSLRSVVLTVFDEAHRCVRDYSYTQLAKLYMEEAEHPLILGLTASPGGSKERVQEIRRNLFIERVEARDEEDQDVKPYVRQTAIEAVKVPVPDEYREASLSLRGLFDDKVKKLRQSGFLQGNRVSKKALLDARGAILSRLKGAEQRGEQKGYIYGSIVNQAQAVMILHAVELLETQGTYTLSRYLKRMRDKPEHGKAALYLMKDERWLKVEDECERILHVKHPKLEKLIAVAKEQFKKKNGSRIIVFTQYRDAIEEIVAALNESGLDARRFVGQSDRLGNRGMDQRVQEEMLEMFREGRFNVLVSSSIGEEGLHVPDVDLVVFYEAVPSEIRSIQRRGRTGRTAEGRVIILLAEGTVDESYYYSSIFKEKRMKGLVAQKSETEVERGRRSKNPTLLDFVK